MKGSIIIVVTNHIIVTLIKMRLHSINEVESHHDF